MLEFLKNRDGCVGRDSRSACFTPGARKREVERHAVRVTQHAWAVSYPAVPSPPGTAWCFSSMRLTRQNGTRRAKSGAFHISGLAYPDNLAIQTNVRASAGE